MTQILPKLITFDEFVEWIPENSPKRYELYNGVIVEKAQPVGDHEEVVGFLAQQLTAEYLRLNLPYIIPKTVLVKPPTSESGYSPDILILNRPNLINEPRWKKESTVTQALSVPLVVEVVSTNWRDDYHKKYADYVRVASRSRSVSDRRREEMGIPEYWIVDYAALGAREYIGKPKQPTILVCCLDEGEYQIRKFRNSDRIVSPTLSELNLTVQEIFQAGNA
jgi:Uma2 family endonuclease